MTSDLIKYSVGIASIFAALSTANGQTQCSKTGIYFEEVVKSCTNYTRCVFGLRSEHTCEGGFQFNPVTSRCDLESIVGCNKCPENIEFGEISVYTDTDNCSMWENQFQCFSIFNLLLSWSSSSGFVCFGEIYPFQVNCSQDLHFDVSTLMCILPEYSNCVSDLELFGFAPIFFFLCQACNRTRSFIESSNINNRSSSNNYYKYYYNSHAYYDYD